MTTEVKLAIRPFQATDQDYNALIALNKFRSPDEVVTVALLRGDDAAFTKSNQAVRVLGELDGVVVARGDHWHEPDSNEHQFTLYVSPAWQETAVAQQMHRYLLAEVAKRQPQKVASEPLEDETFRIKLLEADGFNLLMRFPRSSLDVRQVALAKYEAVLESVRQQGIHFVTLTDVMASDPNWQHNVWQLFGQIERDIPTPHPEPPTPFAQYTEYYKGDYFRPDSWAIALDENDAYVGMCVVNVMARRPSSLFAGITGVIRNHRRRKIATALKLQSVKFAQQNGFTTIFTDNEENNPMYQLNIDLGFKPLPAWLYYEKSL